jgi:hypothetical protein
VIDIPLPFQLVMFRWDIDTSAERPANRGGWQEGQMGAARSILP